MPETKFENHQTNADELTESHPRSGVSPPYQEGSADLTTHHHACARSHADALWVPPGGETGETRCDRLTRPTLLDLRFCVPSSNSKASNTNTHSLSSQQMMHEPLSCLSHCTKSHYRNDALISCWGNRALVKLTDSSRFQ